MINTPQMMKAGEQRKVSIRVINLGTATLSGLGKYPVRLSYQWRDTSDKTEGFNYRTDLPATLRPGETIVMAADLQAPTAPGRYHLDIDLVQELIAWFRNKGGQSYSTYVTIINN